MSVCLAGQVFGKHVSRWIETSQAALCLRCQQIEASGLATAMLADRTDEGQALGQFHDTTITHSRLHARVGAFAACKGVIPCSMLAQTGLDHMGLLFTLLIQSNAFSRRRKHSAPLVDASISSGQGSGAGVTLCFS